MKVKNRKLGPPITGTIIDRVPASKYIEKWPMDRILSFYPDALQKDMVMVLLDKPSPQLSEQEHEEFGKGIYDHQPLYRVLSYPEDDLEKI